jgi:flagellar hook protein FlgE
MLESINIGMSGLLGYSKGLRVIANNTANLNTPGFKSSSLQFADMFASRSPGGNSGLAQVGYGLDTTGTTLNFKQGELKQTGNSLDLAIDGQGLFTLKDAAGHIHYTRAGQFQLDTSGALVNRADGAKVMGRTADGVDTEISVAGQRTKEGKATSTVTFSGNISTAAPNLTIGSVKVLDALGAEHQLTVKLTNTDATTAGSWKVELMEGALLIGTGQIIFASGRPQAGSSKVTFTYLPSGAPPVPVTLDFSGDVTSFASGTLSTLAVASQDGFAPGTLSDIGFDAQGTLVLTYSNGQTTKGARLLLGRFDSLDAVEAKGGNQFDATDSLAWRVGLAGDAGFGNMKSGMVEISNVDLSQEFSDLVIMQRGYQAASQVITTANEMLQELFSMKGKS